MCLRKFATFCCNITLHRLQPWLQGQPCPPDLTCKHRPEMVKAQPDLQVLKPRDCVAMVIIITGLLIVVVDRYKRERQRVADAAQGEYAMVPSKELDGSDGDVELALTGGSSVTEAAPPAASGRRSTALVSAEDGHVPIDAGMLIATALPSKGIDSRTSEDHSRTSQVGTFNSDVLGHLRPDLEVKSASVPAG